MKPNGSRPHLPRSRSGALLLLLAVGCADPTGDADEGNKALRPAEAYGTRTAPGALSTDLASTLAHPEYDIYAAGAGSWWMHSATAADIQTKMNQGYRLISVDTTATNPPRFTAAFVLNSGIYSRAGQGFADLTSSELDGVLADVNRRVVDIAPYMAGNTQRFGTVWMSNLGAQKRRSKVVRGVSWNDLVAAGGSGTWRLIDLESQKFCSFICNEAFYGVFVENSGNDYRKQVFGFDTVDKVNAAIGGGRLAEIEVSKLVPGRIYYVFENREGSEQGWWGTELFFDNVNNTFHPDSLVHAPVRFGGRYTKLEPYTAADGTTRYAAILVSNTNVPTRGSDTGGSAALAAIDAAAAYQLKEGGVPGLVLAIMKDGRIVHAKGYGHSDLTAPRVAEPTDMFRLASVSKTIGATAVLRLLQDANRVPRTGQPLNLNTRVFGDIFAYTPPATARHLGQITVRWLLEHRTGLSDDFGWLGSVQAFIDKETALNKPTAPNPPFVADPGTIVGYKSSHFHLAGLIVKEITGLEFDDFVARTLFQPLGLARIKVSLPTGQQHPAGLLEATNYMPVGPGNRGSTTADPNERGDWALDPPVRHPASSYAASPIDLLHWTASLDGRRDVIRSLTADTFGWITNQATNANEFGLGFATRDLPSGRALEHAGLLPGVVGAKLRMRADGISFALMVNSDRFPDLTSEIDLILDSLGGTLPNRDLTSQYLPAPSYTTFDTRRWQRNAQWCASPHRLAVGDFNGDKHLDMLCVGDGDSHKWIDYADGYGRFNGTDWEKNDLWCSHQGGFVYTGDFNGDGRDDLLCHDWNTGYKWIDYANADGQFGGTDWELDAHWCGQGGELFFGDFNGDHRTDLLCRHVTTGQQWVDLADANGHLGNFEQTDWTGNVGWCSHAGGRVYVGDFNGDGRDDILCHDVNDGSKWINYADVKGQFGGPGWSAALGWCRGATGQLHIGDYNGDGRDDMLCHETNNGYKWLAFATTTGTFTGTSRDWPMNWCAGNTLITRDYDGDGVTDFLCHERSGGYKWAAYLNR